MHEYRRPLVNTLVARMREPRRFIQMLVGPRQTGKSTAIRQALAQVDLPRTSLGKHRLLESRLASRPMAPSPQPHQRGVAIGITRHRRGAAGQPMVGRREGTVGRRYLERHRPARGFDRIVVDPPSTRPGRGTYRSIRNDPEHPLGIRRMQGCVRLLPR